MKSVFLVGSSISIFVAAPAHAGSAALAASPTADSAQPATGPNDAPEPAPEQLADEAAAGTEGEIIVTAQKRSQSLQDVPLAISAVTEEALTAANVTRLDLVQTLVPSLQISQTQANFFTTIRGVGDTNFSVVSDPAVPFYVDGLYYPRANGPNAILFDIARIEVLRGPQGTLYGRNATGGVINVIPHQPGTVLGGEGSVQYGNYDAIRVGGAVDVPLADGVYARIAGVYNKREGYTRNLATGPDADKTIDRVDDVGLRATVRFELAENLTIRAVGSYFHGTGGSSPQKYIGPNPNTPIYRGAPQNPVDPRLIFNDARSEVDLEDYTLFAESTLDIGFADWTTQIGYLNQSAYRFADIDGSSNFIINSVPTFDTELVTIESRLAGNSRRLDWVAGVFYLTETARNDIGAETPTGPFLRINKAKNKAYAIFGEGTYSLTDSFRATLGLRYTRDEKRGSSETLQLPGNPPLPRPTFNDVSFNRLTWRVGAEYSVTDDSLFFANVSRGYKAGGFNFVEGTPYDPENLIAYEVGTKNSLFDRLLTLNISAFYYDYTNLQLNQLVPPVPPATIGTAQVTNAASSRNYGAELEIGLRPTRRFNISGFVTYLDAKFRDFRNDDSAIPGTLLEDLSGNRPPFSPKWSVSLTASYEFDLGGGYSLTPRVNEYWRDESFLREFNRGLERVPSFFKTDLNLELAAPNNRWTLSAFVNNLENNDVLNYVAVGSPAVGFRFGGTYNPPRTYGVRVGTRF